MRYIYILLINLIFTQIYFTDIPDNTGESHLVIIENILGLEPGDEIGLFDTNGLTNSGNCSSEYGDLLVGAGIYSGEQLNVVGVGSIDFCDFTGGYQLAGWVEDNPITIKVWDASQNQEYVVNPSFENDNNSWNGTFSVINTLIVDELSVSQINDFRNSSGYSIWCITLTIELTPVPCTGTVNLEVDVKYSDPTHNRSSACSLKSVI